MGDHLAALRDRQRLGGPDACDPLQPQHELRLGRQGLPVEHDRAAPGGLAREVADGPVGADRGGAAARRARALATEEIAIVCAGTDERAGLEDVYAAGVLAEYLLAMGVFTVDDGARIALTIRRNAGNPIEALGSSGHGQHLGRLGLGEDVRHAAQVSISRVVPVLAAEQDILGALKFVAS